jgi:hypothetical protein
VFIAGILQDEEKLLMNEFLYQGEIKRQEQQTRNILMNLPTNVFLLGKEGPLFVNQESQNLIDNVNTIRNSRNRSRRRPVSNLTEPDPTK